MMCPGATRSDSTAMVAAITFPEPYLARSSQMVDAVEQRNDRPHRLRLGEPKPVRVQLRRFHGNPEDVGGRNFEARGETGTLKFPKALSKRSWSG
jgi:hypothetical protein